MEKLLEKMEMWIICPEVCEGNSVQILGSRVADMPARTCGVTVSQVAFQKKVAPFISSLNPDNC